MRNKLSGLVLAITAFILITATGDSSSWKKGKLQPSDLESYQDIQVNAKNAYSAFTLIAATGNSSSWKKWKLQPSDLDGYQDIYDWREKHGEAYCSKVEIKNSKVEADEKGPLKLSADMKNAGNQTLKEVGITVLFLAANGKPVFEKKVRPLHEETFLRPGYSVKFNLSLEDVPSVWSGAFKIVVDGLEFSSASPFSHNYVDEIQITARLNRSDNRVLEGDFDAAISLYRNLIKDYPDTPWAKAAARQLERLPRRQYDDIVRSSILGKWKYPPNIKPSTSTIVDFEVERDGSISHLYVWTLPIFVLPRRAFDESIVEAILAASPLPPFPTTIKENQVIKIFLFATRKEIDVVARITERKINLDTATKTELEALPGIDPVRAQALIKYRAQHGGFKNIDEIKNVKGIDKTTFKEVSDLVTVTTEGELKEVKEIVAKSWLQEGNILGDLGHYDSAIEYYERLIHNYPESKYAQQARDRIIIVKAKLKSVPKPETNLICRGIIDTPNGLVAFIDGKKSYVVKKGDIIEGWKIIKIEENKVKLYNEEEKKGLTLLKGGPGASSR